MKRFAALVGERVDSLPARRPQCRPDPFATWRPIFQLSHFAKKCTDLVDRLRREATRAGSTERGWDLLAEAVRCESAAFGAETQAEEMVTEMRRQ